MTHKTDKEETEFEVVPETITLCVKCGVAGSGAANNLCQACLAASTSTPAGTGSMTTATGPINHVFVEKSFRSIPSTKSSPERNFIPAEPSRDLKEDAAVPVKRQVNRCSGCRRKVGLTGFQCRCGELFCADHRYSDRHDCSYDYKAAGREAISRENPVVKASKIVKI